MMIIYNLKNKYNIITEEQFDKLGDLTEGYSYSDINNLTQEVINFSKEKCFNAIYFKYLDENHIIPCIPNEQGSFEIKNKEKYDKKDLITPIIIFEYFTISLQKIKPTVNKTILEKYKIFTEEKSY
jgi:SpoVK/Ycf46/Vps4 family AAA+-type ATPase